jgi:hypothetical protein
VSFGEMPMGKFLHQSEIVTDFNRKPASWSIRLSSKA